MDLKLKIIYRAVKIRLANGEELNSILASYTKLTQEEIKIIKNNLID